MKDFFYAAQQIGLNNLITTGKSSLVRYYKLEGSAFVGETDFSQYGRNSQGWGGYNSSAPGLPAPGYLLDQHVPTLGACFQAGHGFSNVLTWNGAQDSGVDNFQNQSWSIVFAGLKPHDMTANRYWHGIGSGSDIGGTLLINTDGSITVTSNISNSASSAAGVIKQYVPHLLIMSYDNVAAKITVYVGDWTGRWVTAISAASGAAISTSAPFPIIGGNRNGGTKADGFLDDYAAYIGHAITSTEAQTLFTQAGYNQPSLSYSTTPGHRAGPLNRAYPNTQTIDSNSAAAVTEFSAKADPTLINGAGSFNWQSFTTSIYIVTKSFRENSANWLTLAAPNHYGDQSTIMAFEDAPVPYNGRPSLGFLPSSGSDAHLAIWCPQTDEYWETGGSSGYTTATSFTATSTNSSTTLSAVSSFTNIKAGTALSGTNIATGATVISTNAGAGTLVMSIAATGSGSALALTASGTDAAPSWSMTYGTKQTGFSLFIGAVGSSEGATATGIPNMLGVPTIAELQNAIYNNVPIPHGLAAVMYDGLATQVWPANRHDGGLGSSHVIEGQLYRLKHDSATTAAIAAMPHPTGRALAQAAQTYGMVIVDRNVFATLIQTEDKAQDIAVNGVSAYNHDPAGKPALGGILNGQAFSVNTVQGFPYTSLELLDHTQINPGDATQAVRPAPTGLSGRHTTGQINLTWPDDPLAQNWRVYQKVGGTYTQIATTYWPQYTVWNPSSSMTLAITAVNGGGESSRSLDFIPPFPARSRRRQRTSVG